MKKDFVACYNIKSRIFNSRHRTITITKYYGTLNGLWIECVKLILLHTSGLFRGGESLNSWQGQVSLFIRVFSTVQGEETRRLVMLDKGRSNTRSTTAIEKGFIKGSTSKEKPSTKSSHGECYSYCKHQDIPRIPTTSFMERRKFLNE
ncbi:hypothetical protein CR513_37042, partial [Mucuna pruriens]